MDNVSRETQEKLEVYQALLLKWQKAINLVGPGTLADVWVRHFEDSMQLLPVILSVSEGSGRVRQGDSSAPPQNDKKGKILADLGSGAGFPGLVLAIMRPDIETHLIESDEKKAQFLRTVSRETQTPVTIHNVRIEEVYPAFTPDVITARALADLSSLCVYCLPWAQENPALEMVFLKGQRADEEVAQARRVYDFVLESFASATDPQGQILRIKNLMKAV